MQRGEFPQHALRVLREWGEQDSFRGRRVLTEEVRQVTQALGISVEQAQGLGRMLALIGDASPRALQRAYALWCGEAFLCPRHPALRRYTGVLLQVRGWASSPPHRYRAARDARAQVYRALLARHGFAAMKRHVPRIVRVLRWYDAVAAYAPWAIETRGGAACRVRILEGGTL